MSVNTRAGKAPPLPIDILILSTLADGRTRTADDIANQWGEDVTRVREWLYKFVKQGLAIPRAMAGGKSGFRRSSLKALVVHIEKRKGTRS